MAGGVGVVGDLIDVAETAAEIAQAIETFSQLAADTMLEMAGNNGQITLTEDYGPNVEPYARDVASDWDAHTWEHWVNEIAQGHSDSAIEGTVVILEMGFNIIQLMIQAIQEALAGGAGSIIFETVGNGNNRPGLFRSGIDSMGRGNDDRGGFGSQVRRMFGSPEARARTLAGRATGGSWGATNGIRSNWRHAKRSDFADVDTKEEFYRKLRAPGLDGIRHRFRAGATDAQMRLFMDMRNNVSQPTRLSIPGRGISQTFIPGGEHWKGFNYGGPRNAFANDPSGQLFRRAEAYYTSYLARKASTYNEIKPGQLLPFDSQNAARNATWGVGLEGYNPYRMQLQFYRGEFAGSMYWEGRSVPFMD